MKKSFLKILSITMIICIAGTMLTACGGQKKEEVSGTYQGDTKKVLREMVSSVDRDLDRTLSIEDTSRYNAVGSISGETLYAFNDISYVELIRRFSNRVDPSVLEMELYLRGFKVASNNILFTTNSDFMKKQKLYLTDFTYFSKIEEESAFQAIPALEERINFFKEQKYTDIEYYKTILSSADSPQKATNENQYEVIYVLGKGEEGFKILDTVYSFGNEVEFLQKKPHLDVSMIIDFVPNSFQNNRPAKIVVDETIEETDATASETEITEATVEEEIETENNKAEVDE